MFEPLAFWQDPILVNPRQVWTLINLQSSFVMGDLLFGIFAFLRQVNFILKGFDIVAIIEGVVEAIDLIRETNHFFSNRMAQAVNGILKPQLELVLRRFGPEDHPDLFFGQSFWIGQQQV